MNEQTPLFQNEDEIGVMLLAGTGVRGVRTGATPADPQSSAPSMRVATPGQGEICTLCTYHRIYPPQNCSWGKKVSPSLEVHKSPGDQAPS